MNKLVFFITLLIGSTQPRSVSWGQIRNGHILLFDQFFHARDDVNAVEPREFVFSSRGFLISGIQVIDLTGIDGGSAKIIQGGVDHTYVKMLLIPKDHHQLLLNIEIFGVHKESNEY